MSNVVKQAYKVRKRVANGNATDEERAWLANYESTKNPPGRPRKQLLLPSMTTGSPTSAAHSEVPESATAGPPPIVVTLPDGTSGGGQAETPKQEAAQEGPAEGATGGDTVPPPVDPQVEREMMADMIAQSCGAWLISNEGAMRERGKLPLSPGMIEKFYVPCVRLTALDVLPQNADSKSTRRVVSIAPLVYYWWSLRNPPKAKEAPKQAQSQSQPASQPKNGNGKSENGNGKSERPSTDPAKEKPRVDPDRLF